jgi:hypothetical protein
MPPLETEADKAFKNPHLRVPPNYVELDGGRTLGFHWQVTGKRERCQAKYN